MASKKKTTKKKAPSVPAPEPEEVEDEVAEVVPTPPTPPPAPTPEPKAEAPKPAGTPCKVNWDGRQIDGLLQAQRTLPNGSKECTVLLDGETAPRAIAHKLIVQ